MKRIMNTKYSIKKVWYYLLCMIMTLQLIACTEETHESYTAAPEVEDIYIDQLEELINKMKSISWNDKALLKQKGFVEKNELKDRVIFLGYQTNPYKYVAKADLFVCASFAEGFSTAATEALIVGTPVCTVEVSGMKEMLGEDNEYGIVTENDAEALYEGIKCLLKSPELLKHYKEQAQKRGDMFSTEKTVAENEDML